jgi:hypothetical protein
LFGDPIYQLDVWLAPQSDVDLYGMWVATSRRESLQ